MTSLDACKFMTQSGIWHHLQRFSVVMLTVNVTPDPKVNSLQNLTKLCISKLPRLVRWHNYSWIRLRFQSLKNRRNHKQHHQRLIYFRRNYRWMFTNKLLFIHHDLMTIWIWYSPHLKLDFIYPTNCFCNSTLFMFLR